MTRLISLLRRPWSDKHLLFEAVVMLARARLLVVWQPFASFASGLGLHQHQAQMPTRVQLVEAERIGWAVRRAASVVPWRAVCLPQAMAAKWMLDRRSIPSTLYLGVQMGEQVDRLHAHAWLCTGEQVVTGGAGVYRYTVVSTFT